MTKPTSGITFGPFRLDADGGPLRKADTPVALQPRPLAVLRHLATRPGVVIGRDELIRALWAGTSVTPAVLKVAVRAIREALGDAADAPRYIETVGREGYRFIGNAAPAALLRPPTAEPLTGGTMVGRVDELATLHAALGRADSGARALVFVAGEAGIGKTTLIDRFVDDVTRAGGAWIARGQCLEQYGEGEAYLPILEAVGRLARDGESGAVADVLRRHAPTWASQLPGLRPAAAGRQRAGATAATMPSRMLREMADALELLTRDRTLVLVLEDLQWSDRSTVDLLACLARRRAPARLLLIGSLRPADVIVHDHPLREVRQELLATEGCWEIPLELLSAADVATYLLARCPGGVVADLRRLALRIYQCSEGNALFMVNVVNDLVARGVLVERDGRWRVEGSIDQATDHIPAGLHQLIGRRLQALLPAVRRTLEVASVAGDEFAVAAVAAGLGETAERVEDLCETLAGQAVLIADEGIAEWPDGTISGRYRFQHALYRRVLYEGIGASRRVRLHRAIGLCEEAAFGPRVVERSAQLAMHFARGHEHGRALAYHERAAEAALDRHAAPEAVTHLTAALDALGHEPVGAAGAERELQLTVAVATLLMAIRGYAAPETAEAFARARTLSESLPQSPQRAPVLRGLVSFHHVRAELAEAHQLGEALLCHADAHRADVDLCVQAHYGHGATLFHMGALDAARAQLEAALAAYEPAHHREQVRVYGGYDPGVACSLWLGWTLALLGRIDEAVPHERAGVEHARQHGDAFSLAWAHYALGVSQQVYGAWAASEAASAEAIRLAEEHGFPHVLGMATISRSWALVMQGQGATGLPLLRAGVAAVEATGAALMRPQYLGMLAAADAMEGRLGAAVEGFDAALAEVDRTGERLHETGLLVGKSHLLSLGGGGRPSRRTADAAEACLRRALDVARGQGARLFELRAAVALARHCQATGRADEARTILNEASAPFVGCGRLTPEIVSARELAQSLP